MNRTSEQFVSAVSPGRIAGVRVGAFGVGVMTGAMTTAIREGVLELLQ